MRVSIGIDIACRTAHQASCADESGALLWTGHRFTTDVEDLERLWARIPPGAEEVVVVLEPTRNAWVPLASWFRRRGARVVVVPSEQSADLRAYYSKHAKTDHLDSRVLARIPLLHPEGLHEERGLGPGDALKRAVKLRSGLVMRRSTSMHRLDALLEIMGPWWVRALRTNMNKTALLFLSRYADPFEVRRLGHARLSRFMHRHSRGRWGEREAELLREAADATIALWGEDGLDFVALSEDIAIEARLALELTGEIKEITERIAVMYRALDPRGIVISAPGVGPTLAAQILGRLGDARRFASLAGVRSFSGLVPRQSLSGSGGSIGGPTKSGDACLREALYMAADHARKVDPQIAAKYHRLMVVSGKHHHSALCTIATTLLTRIATCLRAGVAYELRDVDGRPITEEEGRRICSERYTVPEAVRAARLTVPRSQAVKRRDGVTQEGVAARPEATPVPIPA
jgi:transposase